jgi:hypothetical protein
MASGEKPQDEKGEEPKKAQGDAHVTTLQELCFAAGVYGAFTAMSGTPGAQVQLILASGDPANGGHIYASCQVGGPFRGHVQDGTASDGSPAEAQPREEGRRSNQPTDSRRGKGQEALASSQKPV